MPLFKCEPVMCNYEPPVIPDNGCDIVEPSKIHECSTKIFASEKTIQVQPSDQTEMQYGTTIEYKCPSSSVAQDSVDYLKNNFTFDFTDTTSPATYISSLQAYCEIDK